MRVFFYDNTVHFERRPLHYLSCLNDEDGVTEICSCRQWYRRRIMIGIHVLFRKIAKNTQISEIKYAFICFFVVYLQQIRQDYYDTGN